MKVEALEKILEEDRNFKKIEIVTAHNKFFKALNDISIFILYPENILRIEYDKTVKFIDIESIEIVKFI